MPRFSRFYFALVAAAAFAACDFEQVIELDVPPYEPRLVLSGFPAPDSVFSVRIGRSTSALDANESNPFALFLDDADVAVYDEDGVFLDTLRYTESVNAFDHVVGMYRSVRNVRAEAGRSYTLRAGASGLPSVEAVARVPEPVPIAVRFNRLTTSAFGQQAARLVVSFVDPPGDQTYGLRFDRTFTEPGGTRRRFPVQFQSADPTLRASFDRLDLAVDIDVELDPDSDQIFNSALFRDQGFDGEPHEIAADVFLFDDGTGDPFELTALLIVMSDDYVSYQQTLALQDVTGDNPFAEPVRIHTNVRDGLGVFAGYAESLASVVVE